MREQATTKYSRQVMGLKRACPSRQRGNCPPDLLWTRTKTLTEMRYRKEKEMRIRRVKEKTKGVLKVGDDEDEDESDGGAFMARSLGSPGDGHTRPFILSKIWTINDFKLTITAKIFKNLQDHYQIPNHIPIHLYGKFEKCYSGKTMDVDMYDAMFAVGLRLPLTALHHQLADFLGLSVNQIALNAWKIFIGGEIL